MDSASQTDNPPEHSPSRLANLIGILVALLTLTLPLAAIAHFSSGNVNGLDQSSYPLINSR